ncbi:MAG: phosphotransacetylase family protein [Chloroflexi bacterium]|nr:phosphotransacetylase family protein [Chloroflexota bacterium]
MHTLYITSLSSRAGKTAVGAAIGKRLLKNGQRVGYMMLNSPEKNVQLLLKEALSLRELPPSTTISKEANALATLKAAHSSTAQETDVVIVEGLDLSTSEDTEKSHVITETLDAKTLIVLRYSYDIEGAEIVQRARSFGQRLLGVVINAVPNLNRQRVVASLVPYLQREGITVLGVLPEDRILSTVSIKELAEYLRGDFVIPLEEGDSLIENVVAGALALDWGPHYFNRKPGKIVITRGDRPDIQWAALETDTRCLVLTGNVRPIPYVVNKAKEKRAPIFVVEKDTISTMTSLEGLLKEAKFNHVYKLERICEIMEQHFEYQTLFGGLRLTPHSS